MSKPKNAKCPFCRRRYAYAGAYENYIRTAHADLDIILASGIRHPSYLGGRAPVDIGDSRDGDTHNGDNEPQYYPEPIPPTGIADSGYESDHRTPELELNDFHNSDAEEMPKETPDVLHNETYTDARFSEDHVAGYAGFISELVDNPWCPFATGHEFRLATWFIQSKVPKTRIDEYFSSGLDVTQSTTFKSAYTLEKHLKTLDPHDSYLEWSEGTMDDGSHSISFFYRNIVDCVRYLIGQIAYKNCMVYAPVREYSCEGARVYSEMHTAEWWWEIQVDSLHSLCMSRV